MGPTLIHYLDTITQRLERRAALATVYLLPIVGYIIDQMSTRIGLSNPALQELNPLTEQLLQVGLWLYVDAAVAIAIISFTYLIVRKWGFRYRNLVLLTPLTYGLMKVLTGISNFILYFST